MSEIIGFWIVEIQDAMPYDMCNSPERKALLSQAASTGQKREQERLQIVMDWMWNDVLPLWQPRADHQGFGKQWCSDVPKKAAESAEQVLEYHVRWVPINRVTADTRMMQSLGRVITAAGAVEEAAWVEAAAGAD